jgi:PKD domain/RTX calcium-binding nonapeptide repeat (4 copies)
VPRRLLSLAAVLAAGLMLPSATSGATYCVSKPSCVTAGGVDKGSGLQAALDDAENDNPVRSRVEIGPGTFAAAGGYSYSGAGPVDIVGAGRSGLARTVIHPPDIGDSEGSTALVVSASGAGTSTVSDLAIEMPDATGSNNECTGFFGKADLESVAISAGSGCTSSTGAYWQGALRHSSVDVGTVGGAAAVRPLGGAITVEDSELSGFHGVYVADHSAALRRVRIEAVNGIFAFAVSSDVSVTADDVLIELSAVDAKGVQARAANHNADATIRNATIVGPGATGAETNTTSGHTANLTVASSIVSGPAKSFDRCCFNGTNNLTVKYSNYTAPTADEDGVGTFTEGPGNQSFFDPGFVSSTDFRLRFDSPLRDLGDPAALALDESTTDLDSRPRLRDGDGDGVARRDIGAFEYQPQRPTAVATAKPSPTAAGTKVAFDGSKSTDADVGDTLTYAWNFDDGAKGVGPKVSHTFVFPGPHRGFLKVTDSLGLTGTATANVRVLVRTPTQGDDLMYGTTGKDTLNGLAGDDRLFGLGGDDTLNGGKGKDKLDGGPGKNSYKGGKGNDTIAAANGKKDQVDCGKGSKDSVTADPADVVKPNCEKVVLKP